MKKILTYAACLAIAFTSCSKDSFENAIPSGYKEQGEHIQDVFGVKFDPNHTWSSTTTGQVTIKANADTKKVQVLAFTHETDADGDVISNVNVLNEADLNGSTQVTMTYDAPNNNDGLYVAFVSDKDYAFTEIKNGMATQQKAAQRAARRAVSVSLPEGEFTLATSEESYASQRGWVPGELLYSMSDADYLRAKMAPVAYDKEVTEKLKKMVLAYFRNKQKNMPLIKSSGIYNEKAYPITTGENPILVSPFYKQDGSSNWGNEVYNGDLYYYYFKDEVLAAQDDPVAYLKNLPKYKAIPFKDCYNDHEDNVLDKRATYALMYWGVNPVVGETKGSFHFPTGYRIGFMFRSKTTWKDGNKEDKGKQGELYLDGRLNSQINSWEMFKNSGFGNTDPRGAWLSMDGRLILSFETGADPDVNDLLMEIEGGIEDVVAIPNPEYLGYTYCFEDTKDGDYDMNDVVIKARRINETQVEYSIIACGAWDEIYVKGIKSGAIQDNKEVHSLFGLTATNQFVNTEMNGLKKNFITTTKTVGKTFSLTDPNTMPYIYNKTKDLEVRIAKQGEDPFGIMIPEDFLYPLEKVCIKDAYLEFNNWGQNPVLSTDWYTKPQYTKVYNK